MAGLRDSVITLTVSTLIVNSGMFAILEWRERERISEAIEQMTVIAQGRDIATETPWGGRWDVRRTDGLSFRTEGIPSGACVELATTWRLDGVDGVLTSEVNGKMLARPADGKLAFQDAEEACASARNAVSWHLASTEETSR